MDPAMTSGALPGLEDRADLITPGSAHDVMLSPAGRGQLRMYLGIAPGVGKTYAMLRDARARRRSGTDTVVAHWERHARPATAAQLGDLELLPARTVTYRGASFAELDVTAVLDRRPELAVVDELAHANLPGERHARRCDPDHDAIGLPVLPAAHTVVAFWRLYAGSTTRSMPPFAYRSGNVQACEVPAGNGRADPESSSMCSQRSTVDAQIRVVRPAPWQVLL
jgi:hypothetical protein